MAAGALQSTKRALVKVLLALAVFYAVRLEVSRESPDSEVTQVYRHGKTNPLQNEKTNKRERERDSTFRRPGDATIRGADGATN